MAYTNLRDKSLKELKDICRSEPMKYSGFSKLRKSELIDFMYRKNSSNVSYPTRFQRNHQQPFYNLSDVAHIFETPDEYDERIQSYQEPKPEENIIRDLICSLQIRYSNSNVVFDKHSDENNDMIYRANKGKYISQFGSLGEHGEGILYHGTDGNNLLSILSDDFRLTTNPVHGHLYGKGIYFTNDIEKAIHYSERGKSTKYIIVCNVHIGDICLGNASMDIHPKMPDKDKSFDTSVDNLRSPKQFIKKKNGTYNILGIITIENYTENSYISRQNVQINKFSCSFKIINKTNKDIVLYWIPPGVTYNVYTVDISKCTFMNIIPYSIRGRDGVLGMKSHKHHAFVCVRYNSKSQYSTRDIVKIFMLVNPSEIINIDVWDL